MFQVGDIPSMRLRYRLWLSEVIKKRNCLRQVLSFIRHDDSPCGWLDYSGIACTALVVVLHQLLLLLELLVQRG